ncbi:MAG: GNAT family N-acetyltransferase, partial [Candidatus Omnitrophota bacterium]
MRKCLDKRMRDLFIKACSVLTAIAFFINILSYDIALSSPFSPKKQAKEGCAWAIKVSPGSSHVLTGRDRGPGYVKEVNADTFYLPQYLGAISRRCSVATYGKRQKGVVVHIQDAHCNYAAQKRIAEIIEYIKKKYRVDMINLEGGKGAYDLTPFTGIEKAGVREKVADYFVKEGLLCGAEYYAINNPDKVSLWGVEDIKLYMKNLDVYRSYIGKKKAIDDYLKVLSHILSNLKLHIYSEELLGLDIMYSQYKAGNLDFKDYLANLIKMSKEKGVSIKDFDNVYLLHITMQQEGKINFKKANDQRDILIKRLQRILSRNEVKELAAKTVDFKAERLPADKYYSYIIRKAAEVDISLKDYPELQKYTVYILTYYAVDRNKVMAEVGELEDRLQDALFTSDEQRKLAGLSKNLVLTKSLFEAKLTKEDYKYYQENKKAFDVRNYISFIKKEVFRRKIAASLPDGIRELDGEREKMEGFYDVSFERDYAFLKNLKLDGSKIKTAMIVTGGFHAENLCALFKENGISYISILPNFRSEEGYESPYFKLLAGKEDPIEANISKILGYSLAIASLLSESDFTEAVYGPRGEAIRKIYIDFVAARESGLDGIKIWVGDEELPYALTSDNRIVSLEEADELGFFLASTVEPLAAEAGPLIDVEVGLMEDGNYGIKVGSVDPKLDFNSPEVQEELARQLIEILDQTEDPAMQDFIRAQLEGMGWRFEYAPAPGTTFILDEEGGLVAALPGPTVLAVATPAAEFRAAVTTWLDRITPRMPKAVRALGIAPFAEELVYRGLPMLVTALVAVLFTGGLDWALILKAMVVPQIIMGALFVKDHYAPERAPPTFFGRFLAPFMAPAAVALFNAAILPFLATNPLYFLGISILSHFMANALILGINLVLPRLGLGLAVLPGEEEPSAVVPSAETEDMRRETAKTVDMRPESAETEDMAPGRPAREVRERVPKVIPTEDEMIRNLLGEGILADPETIKKALEREFLTTYPVHVFKKLLGITGMPRLTDSEIIDKTAREKCIAFVEKFMGIKIDSWDSLLEGKYRAERTEGEVVRLGEGKFGAVYSGRNIKTGEPLAFKIPQKNPRSEMLLFREAAILDRLSRDGVTKGITSYFGSGVILDGGVKKYYMAMGHAGVSLENILRERLLTPEEAALLSERILSTLRGLHKRNILHLDLKPANIYVSVTGYDSEGAPIYDFANALLGDFGGSLMVEDIKSTALDPPLYASPLYTPPELLPAGSEKFIVSDGTDLFALGVTLYEAMNGAFPKKTNRLEVDSALKRFLRSETEDVPNELKEMIASLTNVDLEDRRESSRVALAKIRETISGRIVKEIVPPAEVPALEMTEAERLLKEQREKEALQKAIAKASERGDAVRTVELSDKETLQVFNSEDIIRGNETVLNGLVPPIQSIVGHERVFGRLAGYGPGAEEKFRNMLRDEDVMLAVIGDEIVGFINYDILPAESESILNMLARSPEHRGKGIGKVLLHECVEACLKAQDGGIRRILLYPIDTEVEKYYRDYFRERGAGKPEVITEGAMKDFFQFDLDSIRAATAASVREEVVRRIFTGEYGWLNDSTGDLNMWAAYQIAMVVTGAKPLYFPLNEAVDEDGIREIAELTGLSVNTVTIKGPMGMRRSVPLLYSEPAVKGIIEEDLRLGKNSFYRNNFLTAKGIDDNEVTSGEINSLLDEAFGPGEGEKGGKLMGYPAHEPAEITVTINRSDDIFDAYNFIYAFSAGDVDGSLETARDILESLRRIKEIAGEGNERTKEDAYSVVFSRKVGEFDQKLLEVRIDDDGSIHETDYQAYITDLVEDYPDKVLAKHRLSAEGFISLVKDGIITKVTGQRIEKGVPVISNRYSLEKGLLGSGGFSVAYKGKDMHKGDELVAIKIARLSEEGVETGRPGAEVKRPSAELLLLREAVILKYLQANGVNGIVDFRDAGPATYVDSRTRLTSPSFYIATGYAGRSLHSVLQERRSQGRSLTAEEASALANRLLETLRQIHDLDILHLDIKPANIFIPEDADGNPDFGKAVLGDFGSALKIRDDKDIEEGVTGIYGFKTPEYSAPEVAFGKVAARSDIYSLGKVLEESLRGTPESAALRELIGRMKEAPEFTRVASAKLALDMLRDTAARIARAEPAPAKKAALAVPPAEIVSPKTGVREEAAALTEKERREFALEKAMAEAREGLERFAEDAEGFEGADEARTVLRKIFEDKLGNISDDISRARGEDFERFNITKVEYIGSGDYKGVFRIEADTGKEEPLVFGLRLLTPRVVDESDPSVRFTPERLNFIKLLTNREIYGSARPDMADLLPVRTYENAYYVDEHFEEDLAGEMKRRGVFGFTIGDFVEGTPINRIKDRQEKIRAYRKAVGSIVLSWLNSYNPRSETGWVLEDVKGDNFIIDEDSNIHCVDIAFMTRANLAKFIDKINSMILEDLVMAKGDAPRFDAAPGGKEEIYFTGAIPEAIDEFLERDMYGLKREAIKKLRSDAMIRKIREKAGLAALPPAEVAPGDIRAEAERLLAEERVSEGLKRAAARIAEDKFEEPERMEKIEAFLKRLLEEKTGQVQKGLASLKGRPFEGEQFEKFDITGVEYLGSGEFKSVLKVTAETDLGTVIFGLRLVIWGKKRADYPLRIVKELTQEEIEKTEKYNKRGEVVSLGKDFYFDEKDIAGLEGLGVYGFTVGEVVEGKTIDQIEGIEEKEEAHREAIKTIFSMWANNFNKESQKGAAIEDMDRRGNFVKNDTPDSPLREVVIIDVGFVDDFTLEELRSDIRNMLDQDEDIASGVIDKDALIGRAVAEFLEEEADYLEEDARAVIAKVPEAVIYQKKAAVPGAVLAKAAVPKRAVPGAPLKVPEPGKKPGAPPIGGGMNIIDLERFIRGSMSGELLRAVEKQMILPTQVDEINRVLSSDPEDKESLDKLDEYNALSQLVQRLRERMGDEALGDSGLDAVNAAIGVRDYSKSIGEERRIAIKYPVPGTARMKSFLLHEGVKGVSDEKISPVPLDLEDMKDLVNGRYAASEMEIRIVEKDIDVSDSEMQRLCSTARDFLSGYTRNKLLSMVRNVVGDDSLELEDIGRKMYIEGYMQGSSKHVFKVRFY